MRSADTFSYARTALRGHSARTLLMLLAMAIGVAAVVVLTGLGEGARRYVTGEFSSLGTELLIVLPGRSETTGGAPPMLGQTPRDLTIDDAYALTRSRAVKRIAPISVGQAPVSWGGREREVTLLGSTPELLEVRHLTLARGRFLPAGDPRRAAPVCVLGAKVRDELFRNTPAVGEWMRMGEYRCRVIGVLGAGGHSLGLDLEEVVVVPVATAQALFDNPSLFRILVEATHRDTMESAKRDVLRIIRERHDDEDDITVITQDSVLATFDRILSALTLTVGGIAAISLLVAGILIMNVMLVAVAQRAAEIGLLKALGATRRDVQTLFITEAGMLSLAGGLIGLGIGVVTNLTLGQIYPTLSFTAPRWAVLAALGVAIGSGLLFGILPARRAARLDPIQALSRR
ncbi:MAG: ABC transporter permease [Proteobacteria bacterium]|nr:MAG: ABC transporter permease [Pseudomonadota bacterium]QKK11043.1 MAG: FtsX-like permease family protein [Pseudomonadota bacterium]